MQSRKINGTSYIFHNSAFLGIVLICNVRDNVHCIMALLYLLDPVRYNETEYNICTQERSE